MLATLFDNFEEGVHFTFGKQAFSLEMKELLFWCLPRMSYALVSVR